MGDGLQVVGCGAERADCDADRARDDLRAFYTRLADEYFRVCRDAVKAISPDTLYLGCRFAWANDRAVRSAAKYCDVIAFNRYEYSVADYKLPDGIDKPAIIGEYHFGALDRGLFHTGLKPTDNQRARASAYRDYVTGALKNSIWVGAPLVSVWRPSGHRPRRWRKLSNRFCGRVRYALPGND